MNRCAVMFLQLLITGCLTRVAAAGTPLPESLERIRVSDDGAYFVEAKSGKQFVPLGFNYDHDADGRLIEDYWHEEWDRVENDFRDMQKLGATVVRVHLQFGKFMKSATEARETEIQQLLKLLALAEETRLYLDLTGLGCYHKTDVPEWYDQLDESARWAAQAVFWGAVAKTCRHSPAVFCYDLMNEPVIGGEQPAKEWLGPAFAGKHFVQFVVKQTNGRTRSGAAKQWIDQMAAAVREHDPDHLVTAGLVDWSLDRPGLTSGFVPETVAENLDFLAVHIYPKAGKVDEALQTLAGFQIGKPVIIEETFPLGCSVEDLEDFMDCSGDQADGWVSFFWGKLPEEYSAKASIADAITSQWIARFSERMKRQKESPPDVVRKFIEHGRKHPEGKAAFSIDMSDRGGDKRCPIGVFDSGIGGLTVLEAILKMDSFDNETLRPGADGRPDFEDESFVYFGDQANMPYGNYPSVGRQEFLRELILKDAAFLMGRRHWPATVSDTPDFTKSPVKAIVIACNTATAWGLDDIRRVVDAWQVPVFVVGVVEAGARGVTELIDGSGHQRTVAVLATVGTCSIQAYPKAIGRAAGIAGKRVPNVVQQGSVGLAGAIEGDPAFVISGDAAARVASSYLGPAVQNKSATLDPAKLDQYGFDEQGLIGDRTRPDSLRLNSVVNYVRYDVTTLLQDYRTAGGTAAIDTVLLGCTHFPLVEQEILDAFARARALQVDGSKPFELLIAEQIDIVDPAELTAKELFRELARTRTRNVRDELEPGQRKSSPVLFFMSVANPACKEATFAADGSLDREYKYARTHGRLDLEDTLCVPMRVSLLPPSSVQLIQSRLPEVWSRLQQSP